MVKSELLTIVDCNKSFIIPLDYPSINFQQDIHFLTKYLFANDWNATEAVKKIVQSYRLKVSICSSRYFIQT